MNDLEKFFYKGNHRGSIKHQHYFDIYERHFSRFRNTAVDVLEVGVRSGGSLQMWANYFGEQSTIYGVDIKPECKVVEDAQIKIFIGDQAKPAFWNQIKKQVPKVDIVIDDGGHRMRQQIVTAHQMFRHLQPGGVYVCEDIETSYKREGDGTFMACSKQWIDAMNGWYSGRINRFTRWCGSMHFYPNIVVCEKRREALKNAPDHCAGPLGGKTTL